MSGWNGSTGSTTLETNSSARDALRAQLNVLLDSIDPHYTGVLVRAHELHFPGVSSLLQDLILLMQPKSAAASTRKLLAAATTRETAGQLRLQDCEDCGGRQRSSNASSCSGSPRIGDGGSGGGNREGCGGVLGDVPGENVGLSGGAVSNSVAGNQAKPSHRTEPSQRQQQQQGALESDPRGSWWWRWWPFGEPRPQQEPRGGGDTGISAVGSAHGARASALTAAERPTRRNRRQRRHRTSSNRRRLTASTSGRPPSSVSSSASSTAVRTVSGGAHGTGSVSRPRPLPARLSDTASPPSLAAWAQRVGERLTALPANLSYPVVRRLVVAVVVRAWVDSGCRPLAAEDDQAVAKLFLQLYGLHRRGAVFRGIMAYQHVSKSGGTSWCHAAKLNGCTTQRFDRWYVCGIRQFEDKVRWVDGAAHRRVTGGEPTRWSLHGVRRTPKAPGCAGRGLMMRSKGWTYYSNEYTLTGGERSFTEVEVCSREFVTAILFRNPLLRLTSHLRFLLLHYSRFMAAQGPAGADFSKTYANANASFWQAVAPAIADNYYARTLLGEATWHEPVGALNTTHHLPAARLVLMQYDIVVPLEAPQPLTSLLLAYGAGWPASYTDVHDKNISALQEHFNVDPTPYMPSAYDMGVLYSNQRIDVPLYELAELIGQVDYLVYSTAAAAGHIPWPGMPPHWSEEESDAEAKAEAEAAASAASPTNRTSIGCGLLRGPDGAWGPVPRRFKSLRMGGMGG